MSDHQGIISRVVEKKDTANYFCTVAKRTPSSVSMYPMGTKFNLRMCLPFQYRLVHIICYMLFLSSHETVRSKVSCGMCSIFSGWSVSGHWFCGWIYWSLELYYWENQEGNSMTFLNCHVNCSKLYINSLGTINEDELIWTLIGMEFKIRIYRAEPNVLFAFFF